MNQVRYDDSLPGHERRASRSGSREPFEHIADRVAGARISVLILGETGVGKEVLAQRIHSRSPHANRPMVSIDCAGLCATLIESQLFGVERGAFTGATQSKPGLFEAADGGTLFLDELGELPAAAQAKLLRVLETRTIQRLGCTKSRPIDVRFLAATNRDLDSEVRQGNFRADLLFRIDGIRITVPPLRDRKEEIPVLAAAFLAEASARERMSMPTLSPGALEALLEHPWPGNLRELRNVVERALALCPSGSIEADDLFLTRPLQSAIASCPRDLHPAGPPITEDTRPRSTPEFTAGGRRRPDRDAVIDALERCAGNQTRAARLLGISRRTLVGWIQVLGLPRPRKTIGHAGAYSGATWAPVPAALGHGSRNDAGAHSGSIWALIPA